MVVTMDGKLVCWNCYNFEDRRDLDGTVLCARNHVPGICCEEFKVRDEGLNRDRLNVRFCLECCNFEDRRGIDGTVVCAKNHRPGVNCEDFIDRFEKLREIRTQNHIRTSLIEHYLYATSNLSTILVDAATSFSSKNWRASSKYSRQ